MNRTGTVGITMGDPYGVGSEIICKALADFSPDQRLSAVIIGDPSFLVQADTLLETGLTFGRAFTELSSGTVPVAKIPKTSNKEVRRAH